MTIPLNRLCSFSRWQDFEIKHCNTSHFINSSVLSVYSPVIASIREKSGNRLFLELPPFKGQIEDFFRLIYGEEIFIIPANAPILYGISVFLQIPSLIDSSAAILFNRCKDDEIFDVVSLLIKYDVDSIDFIQTLSNSFERIINLPIINLFSPKLFYMVFDHPSFDPVDSTSVFELIMSFYEKEPNKYINVLKLISSKYLNPSNLSVLVGSSSVDLNDFKDSLTEIITNSNFSYKSSNLGIPIKYQPGSKNGGVFDYYRKSHSLSTSVSISASSEFKAEFSVRNLIDNSNPTAFFSSAQGPLEWILIRLLKGSLAITHYTLVACDAAKNGMAPISWTFEGSNDEVDWKTIDNHVEDRCLCSSKAEVTFPLMKTWESFKVFRFTQIDNGGKKNKRLVLASIELYGVLTPQ